MCRLFLITTAVIAILLVGCERRGSKDTGRTFLTPGPSPRATATVVR